jgi:hypothetical protein
MSNEIKELKNKEVTRRSALAASALALTGLLAPKEAKADTSAITKNDANKMSFTIANQKNAADKFERKKNKNTVINSDATDDTYPTAKAVYDFIKDKANLTQEGAKEGEALFVGEDGKCSVQSYKVDTEFKDDSKNPVQGKVIYNQMKEIQERVSLDDVPTKAEEDKSSSSEGESTSTKLKHVCKSNGYWITYQAKQDCPANFMDCKMGINYRYEGKLKSDMDSQKWAVNRSSGAFTAICEDQFGAMYVDNRLTDTAVGTWQTPKLIWHT